MASLTDRTYIQWMDSNHQFYNYVRMYEYYEKGPLGFNRIGALYVAMSIIFGLAAYDQYIRAFKFVGNREVKKIKWEKGFDQNRASEFAAGKLPATRFLSFWACVVMCFDFTTRAAQQWDLRNNYFVGFYFQWSMNLTYALECGVLMHYFAENIGMEGVIFYTLASIFHIVLGVFTEFMRGSAHWLEAFWSALILYAIMQPLYKRVTTILEVLGKHQSTLLAHWYLKMGSAQVFIVWWLFTLPWLVRDDIDLTHGWLHRDYVDCFHACLVFFAKVVFGYLMQNYVLITEEIHMEEILRAMHWDVDADGEKLMTDVPAEVIVVTTPAILNHATRTYIDPESTRIAKMSVRAKSTGRIELTPEVMQALADGTFNPKMLRRVSSKTSIARQNSNAMVNAFKGETAGEGRQDSAGNKGNKISVADNPQMQFGTPKKPDPANRSDLGNLFGILPPKAADGQAMLGQQKSPKNAQSPQVRSPQQSGALPDNMQAPGPSMAELVAMQKQMLETMGRMAEAQRGLGPSEAFNQQLAQIQQQQATLMALAAQQQQYK